MFPSFFFFSVFKDLLILKVEFLREECQRALVSFILGLLPKGLQWVGRGQARA